jgi:hypothetical protein
MRNTKATAKAATKLGDAGRKQAKRSNVAATSKPSKPGKAASKPAPVSAATEAKPDPRAAKAVRVTAEREAVAALFSAFDAIALSIPVKPLSAFKLAPSAAHTIMRNPSLRQAAAIAVLFAAHKPSAKLADGATAPRVFEFDGARYAAENGVLADAISSGLITVSGASPETETVKLAKNAAATITGLIGATKLGKLAA